MEKKQTVYILGGTGAIGAVLAEAFAKRDFAVGVIARHRLENRRQVCFAELQAADATREEELGASLDRLTEKIGAPTALVYSVARPPDPDVPLTEYSLRDWNETFSVYTTGFFLLVREAARRLTAGGHLVAIGSAVTRFSDGALPPLHLGHYAAAKAALNELCKWARRDFHNRGLLLSRISPSAVDVPYHREAPAYRRPSAVVPMEELVGRILDAVTSSRELDEDLVAVPKMART